MPLHKGLSFSNSYADEKLINFNYHTNYCYTRISSVEKSPDNTGEKISYFFTCA